MRVPDGVKVRVKELKLGVLVVLGVREVGVGVCVSLWRRGASNRSGTGGGNWESVGVARGGF